MFLVPDAPVGEWDLQFARSLQHEDDSAWAYPTMAEGERFETQSAHLVVFSGIDLNAVGCKANECHAFDKSDEWPHNRLLTALLPGDGETRRYRI